MTLQRRLTILAGTAVALAVAAASIGLYLSVREALRDEIDRSLQDRLEALEVDRLVPQPSDSRPESGLSSIDDPLGDQPFGGTEVFAQVISSSVSSALSRSGEVTLPVGERERAVAAGQEPAFFADAEVDGQHLRVLTGPTRPGLAVQLARPLDELDATLDRLTLILAGFTVAGLGLGAALGHLVARSATRPIRRLGAATRRVRSTLDLSARVDAEGRDELAELAHDFNAMLESLEASQRSQRQLVADASHELRTPVTSLRTYLEFLRREDDLPDDERDEVLGEAVDQVEELAALVADLVELARGEHQELTKEPVRLDLLVNEAVERTRHRAPGVVLEPRLEPTTVAGSPDLLLRAVKNLLDNAVKWSPPGRRHRSDDRRRRRDRSRPRPGLRARRPPSCLRSLLPLARGSQASRLGPGPRDREACRGGARRHGDGRERPRRRSRADARPGGLRPRACPRLRREDAPAPVPVS